MDLDFSTWLGPNGSGKIQNYDLEYEFNLREMYSHSLEEIFQWCDVNLNTHAGTYFTHWDYVVNNISLITGDFKWSLDRHALASLSGRISLTFKFLTEEDRAQFILAWS